LKHGSGVKTMKLAVAGHFGGVGRQGDGMLVIALPRFNVSQDK
jgi:hypothetical protein